MDFLKSVDVPSEVPPPLRELMGVNLMMKHGNEIFRDVPKLAGEEFMSH